MVNTDLFNRLMSLVRQNIVTCNDIKLQEYKDAVVTECKNEVVSGVITAEQFKEITGQDYTT